MNIIARKIIALTIATGLTLAPLSVVQADLVFDIDFPQVSSSTAGSAPISGSCDTDGASISITVSDGSTTAGPVATTCNGDTWSTNIDVTSLEDGSITASVVIGEEDPTEQATTKDTTPPEISVYVGDGIFSLATLAEGHTFDTADPLFEFNQDDGDGISEMTCAVDAEIATDCLNDFFFQATSLGDGAHILTLNITSDIGNSTSTVTNFCVNTCEEGEEGGGDPETESVFLAIRDGATLIGPVELELPAADAPDVSIAPTGTTTTYNVPARSVLALLTALDTATTTFEITDLAYFSGFNSFLINCINIPAVSETDECFSWTYAVNAEFPSVGMDVTELASGDVAYVFFGSAWQVSVSDTSVETDEEFTATISTYDAENGVYVPAPGEIAGAVQFDDFFTPTEFATALTDENGEATLSVATAGEYFVGAQSVFYFPNVAITVSEPEEEEETPSGGGGGGGGGISHLTFNVPAALDYLAGTQNSDGSFSSSLLTDWVALAFAAQNPLAGQAGDAKAKLTTHLTSASPALSGVQDYIRHAMALMSLGIDPYTGAPVDYIAPIVASYDGTQIGDASLDNDDIFALFPLTRAGYGASDLMIQNIIAFIVSRQAANGSWTGGVDTTAAAVQALSPFSALPGVQTALTKAETYLHSQQQNNGGFGLSGQANSFATSWSMQAIAALGQNETQWAPGGLYPRDYLALLQQGDGGVEPVSTAQDTRVWATAYAIPGALGKTWYSLLSSFSRPGTNVTGGGGSVATSTATTTPVVATTTAPIATSTPPQGEVLSQIIEEVADESPEVAFETRIAQVTENEPDAPATPAADATTAEQALEQLAAAAIVSGTNWSLIVLAFLALILFGIVGYVAFVRKYWN